MRGGARLGKRATQWQARACEASTELKRRDFPLTAFPMTDDQRFGLSRHVSLPGPLRLDGGVLLSPVDIAYETYGDPAPSPRS